MQTRIDNRPKMIARELNDNPLLTDEQREQEYDRRIAALSKPPYSKDGKLQLCSRCGNYARRTLNLCPTCENSCEAGHLRDSDGRCVPCETFARIAKVRVQS